MRLVSWDAEVFGFPVAQIESLRVSEDRLAHAEFRRAREWFTTEGVRFVSCRLHHERLAESIFLEEEQFRFIEMVLHPHITGLDRLELAENGMLIAPATEADLPALIDIAESAFSHERFHIDPRMDSMRANMRYGNWVKGCMSHPTQSLLKVTDAGALAALFVVEFRDPVTVYWHLTAVSPHFQGKGIGRRAWRAMMRHHQLQGVRAIETTISARNTRILNLYASLGYRFLPPEMTFHYVKNS